MKTLILGMGNTLLSDDGIGIITKRFLERQLAHSYNIDFCETSWGGFRIIDLLKGYDYAIIVDSIKTNSKEPGYIHHLRPTDLLPTLRLTSYHDINFITALKLAEELNEKVPSSIDIYAMEIDDNLTICESINSSLWNSVIECSAYVLDLLIKHNIVSPDKKIIPPLNTGELLNELYSEEYETDYADTSNN
ncbi:MAG: hydrogenase maturation protease, partial [Ignavibacteria bacterium]